MSAYRQPFGLAAILLLVACGSNGGQENVAADESAIQGGVLAPKDNFSIAISIANQAICSGTLIAPNLVLTARHCVEVRPSSSSDGCENEAIRPISDLTVTSVPNAMSSTTADWIKVSKILVGPKKNNCDPDIAMVELAKPFSPTKATVVTPQLDVADLGRTHFSPVVTAVGYGRDDAMKSGTRRKRENIRVLCVFGDTNFNCAGYSGWAQKFEIIADRGVCHGDSGGGLYDQESIAAGKPVVVATVSRGPEDDDGICLPGAFVRTDMFADWIKTAARDAAGRGGFDAPAWAGGAATPQSTPPVEEPPAEEKPKAPAPSVGEDAEEEAAVAPPVAVVTRTTTTTCSASPGSNTGSGLTGLAFAAVAVVLGRRRRVMGS